MRPTLPGQIEAIITAHSFGRPTAARRGRNPRYPWVPIIDFGIQAVGVHRTRTEQIRGKAFTERDDAVKYAERCIEVRRAHLRVRLHDPCCRALREQYGLPADLTEVA